MNLSQLTQRFFVIATVLLSLLLALLFAAVQTGAI